MIPPIQGSAIECARSDMEGNAGVLSKMIARQTMILTGKAYAGLRALVARL